MSRARSLICLESLESRRFLSAGALDPTFGNGGVVLESVNITKPNDMVVQSDGKILISDSTEVMRFNADGSVDTSFGTNGVITPDFTVAGVAVQSDGKIVVGGSTTVGWAAARYNANGTPDTTFGSGTGQVITQTDGLTLGQTAYEVGIQPDGDIVVGGNQTFPDPSGNLGENDIAFAAICFNPDGSVNTAFGTNGETTSGETFTASAPWANTPFAMDVAANGNIAIDGRAGDGGNTQYGAAIVFSSAGAILTSSDPGGYWGYGTGVTSQSDSSYIYTDDNFFMGQDSEVIFPTQTTPFVFDPGASDSTQGTISPTVQSNGQVVVLGSDSNGLGLVRYNTDGSVETTFGSNGAVLLTPQELGLSGTPTAYNLAMEANVNILFDGTTLSGQLFLASVQSGAGIGHAPPISKCDPASITRHGRFYYFSVQYTALQAIDQSTLGNGNIVVAGPHGVHERAVLGSSTEDGNITTAVYRINIQKLNATRPRFNLSLDMQANQVYDNFDNSVAAGLLAQFKAVLS